MADPGYELGIQFTLMTKPALQELNVFASEVEKVVAKHGEMTLALNVESNIGAVQAEMDAFKSTAQEDMGAKAMTSMAGMEPGTEAKVAVEGADAAAQDIDAVAQSAIGAEKAVQSLTAASDNLEGAFKNLKDDYSENRASLEHLRNLMGQYDSSIESSVSSQLNLAKSMRTSQGAYDSQLAAIQKQREARDAIQKQIDKLTDTTKNKLLPAQQEALKLLKIRLQELDNLEQRSDEELKSMEQKLKLTQKVSAASGFLSKAMTTGTKELGAITEGVNKFLTSGNLLAAALPILEVAFLDLVETQDMYAKANFRAAGSVTELMHVNTDLQGSLALTSSEAAKAAKAVADAGINAEEGFGQAAKSVSQFTTVTGASAQATAEFSKQALVAFKTSEGFAKAQGDLRDVMGGMVNAMKAGGLSSGDMNQVMGKLSKNLLVVRGSFGAEAAKEYAQTMAAAAAASKKLGLESDTLTTMLDDLTTPMGALDSDFMVLYARAGVLEKVLAGTMKPAEAYAQSLGQVAKDLGEVTKSGTAMEQQLSLVAMGTARNEQEAAKMIASFKAQGSSGEKWLQVQKDMAKEAKKKADLDKQWAEATDTLKMTLMKALMPLIALIEKGMVPLISVLTVLLKPLQWVASAFDYLTTKFNEADPTTQAIVGGMGKVVVAVLAVGVAFKVAALASGGLLSALGGLALAPFKAAKGLMALGKAGKAAATLGPAGKAMQGAATGASSLGKAANPTIGKTIFSFFNGLAQGLAKLANPAVIGGALVAIVTIGLLAAILVITARHLKGFEITAIAAALAIIGMAVAFYIMAPALVAVGGAGLVAIPILAVFALVVLAVGAAVLMAAYGISLIVEAAAKMVEAFASLFAVITFESALVFGVVALGIYALGASMLAVPLIIVGFVALAAAFLAAWGASKTLNQVVPKLVELSKAGKGLWQVGTGMSMIADGLAKLDDLPDSVDARLEKVHTITAKSEPMPAVKFAEMFLGKVDDASKGKEDKKMDILENQLNILNAIFSKVAGSPPIMVEIMQLLQAHLPEIDDKLDSQSSMSTRINQWV